MFFELIVGLINFLQLPKVTGHAIAARPAFCEMQKLKFKYFSRSVSRYFSARRIGIYRVHPVFKFAA